MEHFAVRPETSGLQEKFSELNRIVMRMEEISESETLTAEQMIDESKVLIRELLEHLQSDLHFELSSDITALYHHMAEENLLARVENATRVIECVAFDKPISVGSEDRHYANAVTAQPEGLRIAMAEADTLGPVRLLVGLDVKALVGFKNDHLSVSEIDDMEDDIRNVALRKTQCRHVAGEIRKEDIRYMVMRIPRRFFPEENMSDEEIKLRTNFVFRGVQIPHEQAE